MGRAIGNALMCLALMTGAPATAAPPLTEKDKSGVADWNAMLDSLRDLPLRILDKLPEDQQGDPLIQQESNQLALGALVSAGVNVLGGDLAHPMFVPVPGPIFGVGQPNADTIYRSAAVDPTGMYRLRGRMGTVRMALAAQHGPSPGDAFASDSARPGPSKGQLDLSSLEVDVEGRFDVLISASRPDGYVGDWWRLDPGAAKVMVRLVSSDWQKERDPTLSIERIDRPVHNTRSNVAALRDKLTRLSKAANFIGPSMAGDSGKLRREGIVNKLRVHSVNRGFVQGQSYYHGAYDLGEDEALIVETPVPNGCKYWSILLIDHLYRTINWHDNQSSLNDSQAKPDRDGVLRIVVSHRDPGVANWLNTAGYPKGMMQGRWTGCLTTPLPNVRKVALSEIARALPRDTLRVTSTERERIVRERRAALQQRPLW